MPLYEYKCSKDGKFESVQKMKDSDKNIACPVCKKKSPRIDSVPARRNPEYGIQR